MFFFYISQNFELEKPNSLIPSVVRICNNNNNNNNNNNHSYHLLFYFVSGTYIISCNLNKLARKLKLRDIT